jgi:hypothetical protein
MGKRVAAEMDPVFYVDSRGGGHWVIFRSPSGQHTIMSSHATHESAVAESARLMAAQATR